MSVDRDRVMLLSAAERDAAHHLHERLGFDPGAKRGCILRLPRDPRS